MASLRQLQGGTSSGPGTLTLSLGKTAVIHSGGTWEESGVQREPKDDVELTKPGVGILSCSPESSIKSC